MDTKLKADVAESAVITELLSRGYRVLQPVGDRLAYDLVVEIKDKFLRLQVKCAWFNKTKSMHIVDNRRTKTNRRFMKRSSYSDNDFDLAVLYIHEKRTFYIMPVDIFISYASSIAIVEDQKRQRLPRSAQYRERWDLLEEPFQACRRPSRRRGND